MRVMRVRVMRVMRVRVMMMSDDPRGYRGKTNENHINNILLMCAGGSA